jgi:uncharacterized protein
MSSLTSDCFNEFERLLQLKRTNKIFRMGKLFNTDLRNYYYDTGTGKVLELDDDSYKIMNVLFNAENLINVEDLMQKYRISVSAAQEFSDTVISEHLFGAPELDKLYTYQHYEGLEDQINQELTQIILELTGRCNLRCGYCIYNEGCNLNRDFNQSDMSIDVAKAAVDYANKHSKEKVAVTFYGGEPLLKFDLLKWVIEYSLQTLGQKELTFSLTTNLTLVTPQIAEYLASIPGLSVVCSFDGPEYVQNSYRKYINGLGSFSEAYRGLKLLADAFTKSKNIMSINAVFAPPYSYEKLQDINTFFSELDFLPANMDINIDYASSGSVDDSEHIAELLKNPEYCKENGHTLNPLQTWEKKQVETNESIRGAENSIYASSMEKTLMRIQSRFISEEAVGYYPFNACCVPGARRLYVSTSGDLYVCERIGISPSIGNIFTGIDFDRIRKFYIKDYSDGSVTKCKDCWAIRLCPVCYTGNYSQTKFCSDIKNSRCEGIRNAVMSELSFFHSIQETAPEKLEFLKDMKVF